MAQKYIAIYRYSMKRIRTLVADPSCCCGIIARLTGCCPEATAPETLGMVAVRTVAGPTFDVRLVGRLAVAGGRLGIC